MQSSAGELARALGATLVGPDVAIDGATQDTRALTPGMLFVPIVAERDGHEFIPAAVARGATTYLTSRPARADVDVSAIEVDDTLRALASIGKYARARLDAHVIAITGSVGKTSTKDLCAATFRSCWPTHASTRSFNNEIGVPLTLFNAPADAQAVVVEMGARGVGHIAELCAIASPTVAIVTVVGAAHLEQFGDLDAVGRAKGEIVVALPRNGLAVLNADDARVLAMRSRTIADVLTFGTTGDVRARNLVLDGELRPSFVAETPWGATAVRLGARGAHNVSNALAALGAAVARGASLVDAAAALAEPVLSPWRMELTRAPSGLMVINDAYNANPVSMRAALEALAQLPVARRIAVLGPMAELGDAAGDAHREIGDAAVALGIEVVSVGGSHYGGTVVDDVNAAVEYLAGCDLGADDAVLVKASRVGGLERLAAALLADGEGSRP